MYSINIQSTEDYSSEQPFKTDIQITLHDAEYDEFLTNHVNKENTFFINIIYNPLLLLFSFSSILVKVQSYSFQTAISHPLRINETMIFSFKNKRRRKLFQENVTIVLKKYLDNKVKSYTPEENLQDTLFKAKDALS